MRKTYGKNLKTQLYIWGIILVGLIVLLGILLAMYNNKLEEATEKSILQAEEMTNLIQKEDIDLLNNIEEASSDMGKSINEALEEITTQENNTINNNEEVMNEVEEVSNPVQQNETVLEPVKKELVFGYPVEGEIVKEFARETLIFSETLQEWTIHNGIDIKADRTTVVKASEEGKIIAIKNDPRYGLTVIIQHIDGYKTIYSNLLTTEFVVEGEEVAKGQSIGTVGNSASFEIADEPHLHFEIMLNNEYIDPKILLK